MTPFVTGVRRSGERRGTIAREEGHEARGGQRRGAKRGARDEERGSIIADWNSSWPGLTCRVHQQIARLVYVSLVAARQPLAFFFPTNSARFLLPADLATLDVIGPPERLPYLPRRFNIRHT